MKKALVFGAVKHAIEKVKELGYEAIVVDQNPNLKTSELADKFKCLPFEDFEENLKFAKEEKIDGVVNATEFAVLVSSYVANKLNLPGLRFEVAKLAKDKFAIRNKMLEAGITNVPQFFEIKKANEIEKIKNKIKFPVILKPASGLGSLNVYKINSYDELKVKIQEVITESFNKKALIETFLEGQEYGAEVFVLNNKVHLLAIMKKNMTPLPYRSELGHTTPSGLDNETENKIENTIKKLIKTIGIDNGPVNFDLILSKDKEVFVIDVGARMGGNAITSHIIPLSKGIDHTGNIVKFAMNDKNINLKPATNKCVVTRILNLDEGIIKKLPDFSKYIDNEVAEIIFEKREGDRIEKYVSDAQRCGLIILVGEDTEHLQKKAESIRMSINKDIERE